MLRLGRKNAFKFFGLGLLAMGLALAIHIGSARAANVAITGTITDPSGAGLQNATVLAEAPGLSAVYGPVSTAADGTYELDLVPGTYTIIATAPDGFATSIPRYTVSGDQTLNFAQHNFSATLTSSNGVPAQGYAVEANGGGENEPIAYTDSNGHFSLNLFAGSYFFDINYEPNRSVSDLPFAQQFVLGTGQPTDNGFGPVGTSPINLSSDLSVNLSVQPISITLKTVDASNNPVSVTDQALARGVVDQTGSYTLVGLTPTIGHTDATGTDTIEMVNGEGTDDYTPGAFQGLYAALGTGTYLGYPHTFVDGETITMSPGPTAPTKITASVNSCGQTVVTWPAVKGVSQYRLERYDDNTGYTVAVTDVSGTSYIETAMAQAGTYGYVVSSLSATNTMGGNAQVDNVNVTPLSGPCLPATPTGLTAQSPTNQAPSLSWRSVSGASSYHIYQNGALVGSTSTTNFTDNSVVVDGTYNYTVTALNSGGESPQSLPVSVLVDTVPPSVSYALSPQPNSSGWNTSTPISVSFNCTDSGSGIASCPAPTQVTTQGTSTVQATAYDNAGNSTQISAIVKIDTQPPTVTATGPITISPGSQFILSVPASDPSPGSGVSGGEYWLGTSDPGQGNGTSMTFSNGQLASLASDPFFSTLTPGSYQLNIRAQDAAGNWGTPQSIVLNVTPAAPTGLSATTPTNNAPVLTWNASSGATGYQIYRQDAIAGGASILVGTSTTPNFTDAYQTGVYNYSVVALAGSISSAPSATFQVAVTSTQTTNARNIMAQGQSEFIPSFVSDMLPGLTPSNTTKGSFDFDIGYPGGALTVTRPLSVTFNAGGHTFFVSSTSVDWMVVSGTGNSQGTFQGLASVNVDGNTTTNLPYTVTGTDGTLTTPTGSDYLKLTIYSDASRTTVLYSVNEPLSKGKIKIN